MPFEYLNPQTSSALRQGEIISDVYELQPQHPPTQISSDESNVTVQPIYHPRLIVITADCDLLWDYEARIKIQKEQQSINIEERENASIMPHVLLCELYEQAELRARVTGSDLWKRIRQNQDERYHHLPSASVGNPRVSELPDLYLDFKKAFSLPTNHLYEALDSSLIGRVAVMPPVYLHDLMHRFYSFLGRVGVPE